MNVDIYLIDSIGSGTLSAMAKPNAEAGLEAEIEAISASGITRIVSLLTSSDATQAGLNDEARVAERIGLEFIHYPIGDFGVPGSVPEYCEFIRQQYNAIVKGQHTVVHCYAGIGRTGIVTASILMQCGYEPLDAFKRVSEKRGVRVPDKQTQIDWVCDNQSDIRSNCF